MCCVVLMMMTGTLGGGGGWGSLVKQENTSQGDCAFRENTVTGEGEGAGGPHAVECRGPQGATGRRAVLCQLH